MLTDEEIIHAFRRAADVLEGIVDPDLSAGDGWKDQPRDEDVPQDDGADPWGADTHTRQTTSQRGSQRSSGSSRTTQGRGSQERSQPRGTARGGQASNRAQSRASRPGADVPESGEFEDSRGKLWEFGLSDAPSCDHRMPAAFVTGTTQKGSQYHAWACPIGYTDNWKDKCDLWEFTS